MADDNHPLNAAEQQELQRQFPRAGYWLGMLDRHPDIHRILDQMPNGNPYAGHLIAAQAQHVPPALPPMYLPNVPAFPGLYPVPNHGYYPGPVPFQPPAPFQLPAPYYHDRAAAPAVARQARDHPDVEISHVDVSIPRNTEVEHGIITCVIIRLPTNLVFNDFFECICANMDLQPTNAILGYKFSGDRVSDPANWLANAEDLTQAMSRATDKIKCARTREVILEIHNLRAQNTKSKKGAASGSTAKKRPFNLISDGDENEPETSISYASQLRQLKQKLFCQKHDHHCYINPIDGEHVPMNIHALTLWAKKILFNEATYQQPPSIKMFDHIPK